MMASQIWLIRHGESASNAGLETSDPAEIPLTDRGREQARDLAKCIEQAPDLIVASPFLRARDTAAPLRERYPHARYEEWPIHEFTYLEPARCANTAREQRCPWVVEYWTRNDPDWIDGPGAESFTQLVQRARAFHERLAAETGFVVVVGHETFFRTYLQGLTTGFTHTPANMTAIGEETDPPRIPHGHVYAVKIAEDH